MAITTDNGKLAVMELEDYWEPGLPMSPGSIDEADQVQLLWGFPEILYSGGGGPTLDFILDLNTRLHVYLQSYYTNNKDLTTNAVRYLLGLTGDMNNRLKRLIQDATDSMV